MKKAAQAIPNTNLKRAREQRNWSQERLAAELGVASKTVSRWERGESRPTPYFREQLCLLFEQSAAELGLLPDENWHPAVEDHERSLGSVSLPNTPREEGLYDPAIPLTLLSPSGLVGRDALLTRLKERLNDGGSVALSALGGMPGVGKTTVAVALARDEQVRSHFSGGILWAGLGPHPNGLGVLARWGRLLGVSPQEGTQDDDGQVWSQALRLAIGQRRLLVVIDDAWSISDARAFLLGGPNCAYLLTTRIPTVATLFTMDGMTVVEELSEEDGLALLERLAPRAVQEDRDGAASLVRAVGGLPLALTLMGHYLRVESLGGQPRRIGEALAELQDARVRLALAQSQGPFNSHSSLAAGSELSLQAVIGASVERLDEQARAALAALAAFGAKPNTFDEQAACAVADCSPAVLDRLSDAGLLELSEGGRLALHQTIADFAHLDRLQQGDEMRSGDQFRLVAYYVAYVDEHRLDYDSLEREIVNLFAALQFANARSSWADLIHLVLALFPFMDTRGLYTQAREQLTHAERAARKLDERASLAHILLHLGEVEQKQGDYAHAFASCTEGLDLARQFDLSELVERLLSTLGWVAGSMGDYARAEEYLQEGLALARRLQHREQVCTLLLSLGSLALSLGDFARVEAIFQEGLELARRLQHPEWTAVMLTGLGVAVNEHGDYARAEEYLQEGLALARRLQHRERTAILLLNLGVLANERGDYALAETYNEEALNLARNMGHGELTTIMLLNLGEQKSGHGDYAQAEEYLQEGLALARRLRYQDRVSSLLSGLGEVALKRGDYAQAQEYLQEGLALARHLKKRDMIAELLTRLGELATEQVDLALAQEYLQEGLALARQVGKPQLTCELLYAWGEVLLLRKRWDDAGLAFGEMAEKSPADNRKLRASAQFGLARVRLAQGMSLQARALATDSLARFETIGYRDATVVRHWLEALPPNGGSSGEM